ncbi:MAG: hypothetical protein FWE58_06170 [Methanobrevibacter sp.]|nr:hypothetical protein [Methanobrevibacter sp.]
MQCRMCGYEFDENIVSNNCQGCGKKGCQVVHCPNCNYGNSPEFEEEFDFIKSLKKKLPLKDKNNDI